MQDEQPLLYEEGLLTSLCEFKKKMDEWEASNDEKIAESREWIEEARESGREFHPAHDPADDHVDVLHGAHHDSALRTLAFVGVYAPSIEGLLKQQFASWQELFDDPSMHIANVKRNDANCRWKFYAPRKARFWRVDMFATDSPKPKTGIVKGFAQLRDALSIDSYYEYDDIKCFEALVAFRNKIFHNGYYWPSSERRKFVDRISTENWSDYFTWSTEGGEPGICFLTEAMERKLYDTCLGFLDSYTKVEGMEKEFGLKRPK